MTVYSLCFGDCALVFFFSKQKTAYELRISDWSSDVCSSDLMPAMGLKGRPVEVTGTVRSITDGCFPVTGPMFTGVRMNIGRTAVLDTGKIQIEIGRASCRERVCQYV